VVGHIVGEIGRRTRWPHVISLLCVLGAAACGAAMAIFASLSSDPTPTLFIGAGLVLQGAALVTLFRHLGRSVFVHVGAIFIVMAALFHGLNEILVWLFPGQDPYRLLISTDYVGAFMLWISLAILLFTLAYLGTVGRPQKRRSRAELDSERARVGRVFDWRLMLVAALSLEILTIAGNGYLVRPSTLATQGLYTAGGLAAQYLLIALVMASLGIVIRFGQRWILPMLLAQSLAVALVGQRWEIFVTAGLLLYALARVGMPIQVRQLCLGVITFALVALVITAARPAAGHISTTADSSLRLDYLASGLGNIGSSATWDQIAFDLGHRFDGNSFGALELQSLDQGSPPLGFAPLATDVVVAVPSFLNPDKNDYPIYQLVEKEYAEVFLNLPLPIVAGVHEDILPTQLGATIGFWGPWGMLVVALFLGAVFGMADRWILHRLTPSRLLVGLSLLTCVLFYEASWDTYTLTLRGILVLLPLVWAIQAFRVREQTDQGELFRLSLPRTTAATETVPRP
jgi:hypothetical protein